MSSIHKNLNYPDNQRGWVLVVGLVILVMLTILSMALMKTTRLEEKMAGATRDMNLSFQAAETALRAAETFIDSQTDASGFDTLVGEPKDPFTIDYWDDAEVIDGELEYVIKKIDDEDDTAPTVFRVTVRGTGGTNNRATLLRSHYAKAFDADSAGPVGRLSWEQLFPSQ
jgi:type IV pilus assembly protein PilX